MYRIARSRLYLTILAVIVLESTLLNYARVLDIQPDLLLITILFFGLFTSRQNAVEAGLVGGLFRDVLSTGFFGINAVLFGITALLVSLYRDKIYKEFFLTQIFLTVAAGICVYTGYFFLRYAIFSSGFEYSGNSLFGTIIPSVLYTSLISPLVFFVLAYIFRVKKGA